MYFSYICIGLVNVHIQSANKYWFSNLLTLLNYTNHFLRIWIFLKQNQYFYSLFFNVFTFAKVNRQIKPFTGIQTLFSLNHPPEFCFLRNINYTEYRRSPFWIDFLIICFQNPLLSDELYSHTPTKR